MKYSIETTETGCIETLEFSDGTVFTKRSKRTDYGCEALDKSFAIQLRMDGFCDEIVEKVDEMFNGFFSLYFLETSELDN